MTSTLPLRHFTVTFLLCAMGAALAIPGALAQTPAGTSSLTFTQSGVLDARGNITVLFPSGEQRVFSDATKTLSNIAAGRYTILIDPPQGTTTTVELLEGSTIIQSNDYPQLSLELGADIALNVKITHNLTLYGTVGVGSDPPGAAFHLMGPNGMEKTGVTPETFTYMPIGQYTVWFETNCGKLPGNAQNLERDKSLRFRVTIKCDTFQPQTRTTSSASSAAVPREPRRPSAPVEQSNNSRFDDVLQNDWFSEFAAESARKKIIEGYRRADGTPTGIFGPADLVNLGQFAKIVYATLELPTPDTSAVPANPRAQGQWFSHFYASAERQDWRVFYSDPEQDPERPVRRGEVAVTFLQALDLPQEWATGAMFKDVSRRTAYASAIETLAKHGVFAGNASGNFEPDRPVSRAEMAKIAVTIHRKYREGNTASAPAAQTSSVR